MKKLSKQRKQRNKGITLIALVITIIVLLILAGVTIATLTGDNGILTRANKASERKETEENKEKIKLAVAEAQIGENGYQKLEQNNLQRALNNQFGKKCTVIRNDGETFTISCLETLQDYIVTSTELQYGINWKDAMLKAVAPESQDEDRNNKVIGIGTNGEPVDMDLWEYTVLDDNTIGLNDSNSLNDINKNKGYLGNFENGKIMGAIPQYVSVDNGKTYLPVTNMFATFCEISELTIMPQLPMTVKDLSNCFIRCNNLSNVSNLPTSIEKAGTTFKGCVALTVAPEIPISMKGIGGMFEGCENLIKGPTVIPNNVKDIRLAFLGCKHLQGEIIIEADLTGKMVTPPVQTDIYRSFYGAASLNSTNTMLKVYLKNNLYDLFMNNLSSIIDITISNKNIKFINLEK